jgi:hypothetical protein
MSSPVLRRIRIVFSTLVFICFFLVFVDFKSIIPANYINVLLYLQFGRQWFPFCAGTYLTDWSYILFVLMSSWHRTGSVQQNWWYSQKTVQKIWIKKALYSVAVFFSGNNPYCSFDLGYLYDYTAGPL